MKFVHTADTHLGFEVTKISQCHPQGRIWRADAVFNNLSTVVQYAMEHEADLFIHSGDLFNKYDIPNQFRRLRDDLVIRFNLTGGTKKGDYPEIDFDRIRADNPEAVECQFAVKAGTKWILK